MILSITEATKTYRLRTQRLDALHDVYMTVHRGDFVMIVGCSGAGKSTLLGVVGGLIRPTVGRVTLDGVSVWDIPEAARARLRAGQMGFVFQNASVIAALTVLENVLLSSMLVGPIRSETRARATELIISLGLRDKAEAYPEQLSGGERRRVAIASALMNNPSVLIADEPTGDLDDETEQLLMDNLARQNRNGTTIVMATHDRHLICYANRLFAMNEGRLVEQSLTETTQDTPVPIAACMEENRT